MIYIGVPSRYVCMCVLCVCITNHKKRTLGKMNSKIKKYYVEGLKNAKAICLACNMDPYKPETAAITAAVFTQLTRHSYYVEKALGVTDKDIDFSEPK